MGGAISFLYAASYPDEVDFLISLDIVSPNVKNVAEVSANTGNNIDKFLKYELLTLDNIPSYEYNEMIDIVHKAYEGSVTKESAQILMKRGMQPAFKKGKYYFSRDPKLKVNHLVIYSFIRMTYYLKFKLKSYRLTILRILKMSLLLSLSLSISFRFQFWAWYPWI